MEPSVVIALYRCLPEKQEMLFDILKRKRKYFLEAGLVTERPPVTIRSRSDNSVILEIFEWSSKEHIDKAHNDPEVLKLWDEMSSVCSEIGLPLRDIAEAGESFAGFDPLNVY